MPDKSYFKEPLGTWFEKFEPFFDEGGMDKIYGELKAQGKRHIRISPLPKDTFKAFEKCRFEDLKCVFLGLAPYASFTKEGLPISDGLAFSCSVTGKEQPSLKLMWKAVQDDLGKEGKRYTDLSFWAHQGVLLLNIALTAKRDKPDSHIQLWVPFMKYFFERVIDVQTGLPIVYFGKVAGKFKSFSLPLGHYNKVVEHPAYASRQERDFKHEKLFSWVNRLLKEQKREEIDWLPDQITYDILTYGNKSKT